MTFGISITISRRIETRPRRADEVGLRIWTGTCWRRADSLPDSSKLAWIYGKESKVVSTKIEFLPPGVVPHDSLLYQQTLLPKMRAEGIIR